jgi:hypothetical protein
MRRFTGVALGVALTLVLITSAQAQVAVGVRAGYNNSTLSITPDDPGIPDFKSRSSFHAGADLAFALSPMFGIEAGVAYSQKGATAAASGIDATFAINYVDVPVLFAVNIPTSSNITPRLFAGGVASFEMSCKVTLSVSGEGSVSEDCDEENTTARKKSYFSALFGGGIGFVAGPGSLLLDVGYQLGLTNLSDETGETAKINVFQVSLGYRFPLGG